MNTNQTSSPGAGPVPDEHVLAARTSRGRSPVLRVAAVLAWIWFVAAVSVGAWSSYWAVLRADHYQLIYLGQRIYDGGRMYVDCWENKPPGLAWINAAAIALAGGHRLGAWIMPGVVAVAGLIVVSLVLKRVLGGVASVCTVFAAGVVMTMRVHDAPSINPDFYCAVFSLAAVSMFLAALTARRGGSHTGYALLAGFMWAGAACVKQTGPLGLVVITITTVVVLLGTSPNRRTWFVTTLCSWAGFAAGVGALVFALHVRGTLAEAYYAVVTFNARYVQPHDWLDGLRDWRRAVEGLEPIQFAVWMGLLGLIAALSTRRLGRFPRALAAGMLVWWLLEVLLALVGPSRSMRYWQATWPPMLILGACAFRFLQMTVRRVGRGYRAGLVLVVITAVGAFVPTTRNFYTYGLASSYQEFTAEANERDQLRRLGEQLQEHVGAGELISVLQLDPAVYLYSVRPCAHRFMYPRSAEQAEEILECIESGRARAVLVPARTGQLCGAYFEEMDLERVREALLAYDLVARVEGTSVYDVYLRKGETRAAGKTRRFAPMPGST